MTDQVIVLGGDDWLTLAHSWRDLGIGSGQEAPEEIADRISGKADKNPAGRNVWMGVREGPRFIAVASYTPKILRNGTDRVLVAEIGSTYTAPAARGRGLFSKLVGSVVEHAAGAGVAALYGTPNEVSGAIYLSKLKWTPVWHWARWLRPATSAARPALAAAAFVMNKGRTFRSGDIELATGPGNRPQIETPAEALPHIERSKEFLEWRYPSDEYKSLTVKNTHGEPAAWAVAGVVERRGRPTLAIADLVWRPDAKAVLARLLSDLRKDAVVDVAFEMAMTGPHSPWDALRDAAFVRRASPMPLIAHPAADATAVELIQRMHFTAGDSDTV